MRLSCWVSKAVLPLNAPPSCAGHCHLLKCGGTCCWQLSLLLRLRFVPYLLVLPMSSSTVQLQSNMRTGCVKRPQLRCTFMSASLVVEPLVINNAWDMATGGTYHVANQSQAPMGSTPLCHP